MKQLAVVPGRKPVLVAQRHYVAAPPTPELKESSAAEVMWAYYKDRKALFIADIRLHRAAIIAALMAGVPVELVFEPYLKPIDASKRAAKPQRLAA